MQWGIGGLYCIVTRAKSEEEPKAAIPRNDHDL